MSNYILKKNLSVVIFVLGSNFLVMTIDDLGAPSSLTQDLLSSFPTSSLQLVLFRFLKNPNSRHAIFYLLLTELSSRPDILPSDLEPSIGLVIHYFIDSDEIDSLLAIVQVSGVQNFLHQFYPGIVTYCVKRTLANGIDVRVPSLWSLCVSPAALSIKDNLKFSLLAIQKMHEVCRSTEWLCELAFELANTVCPGSPEESQFLNYSFGDLCTVAKLNLRQNELFREKMKDKIFSDLSILEFILTDIDREKWNSPDNLLAIGGPSFVDLDTVTTPTQSIDRIIEHHTGIKWSLLCEVVKKSSLQTGTQKTNFSDLVILTIFGNIEQTFHGIKQIFLHRNLGRFLILYCLNFSEISRKLFFQFSVEIIADSDCELLAEMSRLVRRKFSDKLCPDSSSLVSQFRDSVFDSIVQGIRNDTCQGSEIGRVVTLLVRQNLDDSLLIDLVRQITSRYSPRAAPIWVMELLLEIGQSLNKCSDCITYSEKSEELDESTLMNPTELISLELISYLKFFIDISEHEGAENNPGENAKTCFVKSVFALRTLGYCLRVFVKKYSQIFIVKMCDLWTILETFFPHRECQWITDEDSLRFLFGLELVVILTESESAKEFFSSRMNSVFVPLVESYSKYRTNGGGSIGKKISLLVSKLVESGLVPNTLGEFT